MDVAPKSKVVGLMGSFNLGKTKACLQGVVGIDHQFVLAYEIGVAFYLRNNGGDAVKGQSVHNFPRKSGAQNTLYNIRCVIS